MPPKPKAKKKWDSAVKSWDAIIAKYSDMEVRNFLTKYFFVSKFDCFERSLEAVRSKNQNYFGSVYLDEERVVGGYTSDRSRGVQINQGGGGSRIRRYHVN